MKQTKSNVNKNRLNQSLAACAIATCLAASAHAEPAASAGSNSTTSENKSFVKLEGSSLKIGSLPPVDFHGFLSQGLLASEKYNYLGDSTHGSFRFTEAGLNASMNPLPRTRITAQAFLFDVGGIGKYEPFLDYASIEYTFNDKIGLRGGRVRKPGGIYTHIQDLDLARTSVLLPQGIYDARWRDFSTSLDGGVVFGNIPLGKGGSLSYEAFAGMVNLSMGGGVARIIENGLPPAPFGSLDAIDPTLTAGSQLWWNTPVNGLRVGALFQYAFNVDYEVTVSPLVGGPGRMRFESTVPIQQYSIEYLWRSWTFQAEYQTLQLSQDTITAFGTSHGTLPAQDSWYVGAAYRFNKWLEVGSYYSEYYAETSDRDGSGFAGKMPAAPVSDAFQKDLALSFRFDPTDWWIVKIEGHYMNGTALLHDNASNPNRNDNGWFMLAVKTTFSF